MRREYALNVLSQFIRARLPANNMSINATISNATVEYDFVGWVVVYLFANDPCFIVFFF